jgi:hypothetical protein
LIQQGQHFAVFLQFFPESVDEILERFIHVVLKPLPPERAVAVSMRVVW